MPMPPTAGKKINVGTPSIITDSVTPHSNRTIAGDFNKVADQKYQRWR